MKNCLFLSICLLCFASTQLHAVILGSRIAGFKGEFYADQSDETDWDTSLSGEIQFRNSINDYLDLFGAIRYTSFKRDANGEEETSEFQNTYGTVDGLVQLHFKKDRMFNPFLSAGFRFSHARFSEQTGDLAAIVSHDNEGAALLGGGFELNFTEKFSTLACAHYQSSLFGQDDVILEFSVNGWLEEILASASVRYQNESEDLCVGVGFGGAY